MQNSELTIRKIDNGYILLYWLLDEYVERYFESKSDLLDFINQIME
jgi:hypothetical protein